MTGRHAPAILLGLLVLSACGRSGPPPALTVGERSFSADYVAAYLQAAGVPAGDTARRRQALDALVADELLAQQAVAQGLDRPAAQQVALDQARRRLLARLYQEHFVATQTLDGAARAAYEADPAATIRRVRALALIVVYVRERGGHPVGEAEAREKITNAYAALRAGRPFAEVAAQYSDDPISRAKGGELGEVTRDALDPALQELTFALPTGDYSEPVRTAAGLAIVRPTAPTREERVPFAAVRATLVERLRAERLAAELARLRQSTLTLPPAP